MECVIPLNLKEALIIIDYNDMDIICGGTDIMVKRKNESGLIPKFNKNVLFINKIEELNKIDYDSDYIYIGSACTYSKLLKSSIIDEFSKKVFSNVASPSIRNMGTIGGNICNASPAGDTLPLLYIMGAKVEVLSSKMQKIISIDEFIKGPSKTILESNEILSRIIIPKESFNIKYYKKVAARKAMAISKVSFAGVSKTKDNKIEDVRIAFGSVGPTVVRIKEAEEEIKKLNFKAAEDIYFNNIKPIDDKRSNGEYRKDVLMNLLNEFLEKIKNSI